MKKYLTIIFSTLCFFAGAQTPYPAAPPPPASINSIEYFIDNNPDFGSGTALTGFVSSANINGFNGTVSLSALPAGFHRIYFRSKDADGKWSLTGNAFFDNYTVPVYATTPAPAGAITGIEYFIDGNPNFSGGTALTGFISSANISGFNGTVNLGALPMGFHRIYFRSKDADEKWSLTNNTFFDNYTVPVYNIASPAPVNIVQLEYFIDNNDLGFGNCTQIPVTPGTDIANLNASINITGLPAGVHRLFIRSKDADGKWTLTNFSLFNNSSTPSYPAAPAPVTNIVQAEYFLDNNDLGFGNCTQIPVTPGTDIANLNVNINVTAMVPGVHRLHIRSKTSDGKWSLTNFSVFDNSSVQNYPSAPAPAPAISNMEYYIDSDPGFGNATALTVPGNTGDISNYAVSLNLSGSLSTGTHYLYIRSKQNPWSLTTVIPFDVSGGALPLQWSYVRAQVINNQTLVSWATEQEVNTSTFEIEHSMDGIHFTKAGEVAAAGNSTVIKKYSFTHLHPAGGFNFYRIKQTDLNGRFTYSAIVKVLNNTATQTVIAPNPVTDILNIVEPGTAFIKTLEVYDSKGALVMRKNINADVQVYSLPVAALSSGNYVLKISYKTISKTLLFIRQ